MRTTSSRVEGDGGVPVRLAMRDRGRAVLDAATRARGRYIPERWLVDLLALALAGVLAGAAALYGLATVSAWVPAASPSNADHLIAVHEGRGSVLDVCRDLRCRREPE